MTKKNLILGGILLVLALSAYIYNGPFSEWKENSSKPKNFIAGFQASDINKIETEKNGKKITIEKIDLLNGSTTDEKWKISDTKDFYLTKEAADKLTTSIRELLAAKLEIVSENKDRKKDFEVDNNGTKVVLKKDNNPVAEFVIGKMTSDYAGVYISKNDLSKVYSAKVSSLNFVFSEDNLYNKEIFTSETDKINKIRFQYPNRQFTIEKKDGKWIGTLPRKFTVSEDKITQILSSMANLVATEVPTQDFKGTGLEKNEIIVQATGSGIDNTIIIGGKNDKNLYYAKTAKSDNIYLIGKEQRDGLNKKLEELR